MIKKLVCMMCLIVVLFNFTGIYSFAQSSEPELKWKVIEDEYGEVTQILDMTEAEIEEYQIAQLKEKYETNMESRSDYIYEYEKIDNYYDSGTDVTDKILIGNKYDWDQRSSITTSSSLSYTLAGVFRTLSGTVSLSYGIAQTYSFDSSYDSCMGLFARLQTTTYNVTKKIKYADIVVATYEETICTPLSKVSRPIYVKTGSLISYKYGETWYYAKMLNPSIDDFSDLSNEISTNTKTATDEVFL